MLKLLYSRWWMLLIQGILLIIFTIYAFTSSGALVWDMSFWSGILLLITAISGIVIFFISNKEERQNRLLIWSFLSAFLGLLMVLDVLVSTQTKIFLFGVWMLVIGVLLAKCGYDSTCKLRGLIIVLGGSSLIAGLLVSGKKILQILQLIFTNEVIL